MKKLIYILLVSVIAFTLSACSGGDMADASSATNEAAPIVPTVEGPGWGITVPSDLELGGILNEEINLVYVDESDPIFCLGEQSFEMTLSDGTVGTSSIRLPYIDADLPGAISVSNHIYGDYTEKYSEYFETPDDRIVNVDYSWEIAQDTLCILMHERIQTPEYTGSMTYVFYYDILVDQEMSMAEFIGISGSSFTEILDGIYNTDWSAAYTETTGSEPTDAVITAVTFNKAVDEEAVDTFDVYCINADGVTQTLLEVTPVEAESPFEMGEIYYY